MLHTNMNVTTFVNCPNNQDTMLVDNWNSYEANFEALQTTGVVVPNDFNRETFDGTSINYFEEEALKAISPKLLNCEVKVNIVKMNSMEVIMEMGSSLKTQGLEPKIVLLGTTDDGSEVFGFTTDDKVSQLI